MDLASPAVHRERVETLRRRLVHAGSSSARHFMAHEVALRLHSPNRFYAACWLPANRFSHPLVFRPAPS